MGNKYCVPCATVAPATVALVSSSVFCSCPLSIKGHQCQPRSIESGFVFAHTKAAVHLVLDSRLEVAVCTSRPWVEMLNS